MNLDITVAELSLILNSLESYKSLPDQKDDYCAIEELQIKIEEVFDITEIERQITDTED